MEMINVINLGQWTVETVGRMKLGKLENFEKTLRKFQVPHCHTAIDTLATPRLGLGTSVGTDEWSNHS